MNFIKSITNKFKEDPKITAYKKRKDELKRRRVIISGHVVALQEFAFYYNEAISMVQNGHTSNDYEKRELKRLVDNLTTTKYLLDSAHSNLHKQSCNITHKIHKLKANKPTKVKQTDDYKEFK